VPAAGIIGSLFTASAVSTWYVTLAKPVYNPPSWVFGPVWLLLYTMMGVSLYLVWQKRSKKKSHQFALTIFYVHLFLNALWSILFFGLKNPQAALYDIVLLWVLLLLTIILFYKISKPASYLLWPYLLWVSFAANLNYMIWILN